MKYYLFALTLLLSGCSSSHDKALKIAATSSPHAEILEVVKKEMQSEGYDLDIIIMDDYNLPNRALAQHEVDANFFQHLPFLEEQIAQFHYPLVMLAKIHIEPLGIYSKKIKNLADLPKNGKIAIPNDPTNEARALFLLQMERLIALKIRSPATTTPLDIVSNRKNLQLIEMDAAMLPRVLEEVDAAVINTNFALLGGLSPLKDALSLEKEDSPYVNVIVVRKGDEGRAEIQALKKAATSEKVREFILKKYRGAIVPAF
jgi:D-methionine transport system substrate-binding protein